MSRHVSTYESIEDLKKLPIVVDWLQFKRPNTRKVYLNYFIGWLRWLRDNGDPELASLTPDELIKRQEELNRSYARGEIRSSQRKLIFSEALRYIQEAGADWRAGTKRKALSTIRTFFIYHLDKEGFPSLRNGEAKAVMNSKVRKVRKELKIHTLKRIIDKANPMYRAVLNCMFVSGMGQDEVVTWSNQGIEELKEGLENMKKDSRGEKILEVYLPARKGNPDNESYVYIGGSALKDLKNWLKHRAKLERRFNDEGLRERRKRERKEPLPKEFPDSIFVTNIFTQVSVSGLQTYYRRKVHQLYIKEKVEKGSSSTRYGVNTHQIRSVFRTRWAKAEANRDIGEYFMGHTIDRLDYNHIHDDREDRIEAFSKALPFLDIENPKYGAKDEELSAQGKRIQDLKEENKRLETRIANVEGAMVKMVKWIEGGEPSTRLLNLTREREYRPNLEIRAKQLMSELGIEGNAHWVIDTSGRRRLLSDAEYEEHMKKWEARRKASESSN